MQADGLGDKGFADAGLTDQQQRPGIFEPAERIDFLDLGLVDRAFGGEVKVLERRTHGDPRGRVLHSDYGKPMRGSTMVSTLQWLGMVPSFSRAHDSDDNPYSESPFRTLKYTLAYRRLPFADAQVARRWVERFVGWYNGEHRHSAIGFVTPDEGHFGRKHGILAMRHQLYQRARASNPERWSRATHNWTAIGLVVLNPHRADTQAAA